jgi:hypothetical protein
MITVKARQKRFTYAETTNLIGICAEHLENIANRHRLGFVARAAETRGNPTDEWFLETVGLDGSSDAVPALRTLMPALTSRNGVLGTRVCSRTFHTTRRGVPSAHRLRERPKRLRLRPREAARTSGTFDSVPRVVCWRRNTKSLHFVKQSRALQAEPCSCPSRTSELPVGAPASSEDLATHLVFEGRV